MTFRPGCPRLEAIFKYATEEEKKSQRWNVSSMTNEHEDGESTKSKLQMQQLKNRSIFGDGSELGKIHLKSILITENSNNTIPDRV